MQNLKPNYPHGSTKREIETVIRDYSKQIAEDEGDINTVLQLTPIILLGQSEIQGRFNKTTIGISLGVAFLSLLISGVALWVAFYSDSSNAGWEERQLKFLEQIRDNTYANKSDHTSTQRISTEESNLNVNNPPPPTKPANPKPRSEKRVRN
jgi:hypothetical protein